MAAQTKRAEERDDCVAHLPRILDVHAVGDVVMVEPVLHGSRVIMRERPRKAIMGDGL